MQDNFTAAFGEPIEHVLDLKTWCDGTDLAGFYPALRDQIMEADAQQKRTHDLIREQVFPHLGRGASAPKSAGLYQMSVEEVAAVHRNLLFNGATECCDGTVQVHDSLLLTVAQIGISLVAYQGGHGTWVQRLYRRDLRAHHPDRIEEMIALLEGSQRRRPSDSDEARDPLTRLVRRAMMEYAERAALVELSKATWRMGHGNPVPVNLLVPTTPELTHASLETLRKLILEHRRFVYVVSEPADWLLPRLGDALKPLQFAIVDTLTTQFRSLRIVESHPGRADRKPILDFMEEVGPEVVTGVYRAASVYRDDPGRAAPQPPARVFYAHKDFACEAAALAIADSVLQPYRGFPLLIDLADTVCGTVFDGASFRGSVHDAYAAAGEPTRYLGERETRA